MMMYYGTNYIHCNEYPIGNGKHSGEKDANKAPYHLHNFALCSLFGLLIFLCCIEFMVSIGEQKKLKMAELSKVCLFDKCLNFYWTRAC